MILIELTELKFVFYWVVPMFVFVIVGYLLRMMDEKREKHK